MADLIKSISDAALNSTLLIVGVGDSIKHLVGEHPSIERNLVQIEVPKMSDEEISQIFLAGMAKLQISTDKDIADEVARLADGYPHYAHLLGLNSAKACIKNDSLELTRDLFQIGCDLAIQDSIEKYRMVFSCATATAQASRYPEILCACALADGDDRGVFRATAVVDAMNLVFNAEVKVQSVVPALGEFCSLKRGPVLEKVQVGNYSHYRFCDSMMRPFLRIKAQAMLRTLYGDAEI